MKLLYSAVVLDDESREGLIDFVDLVFAVPYGWKRIGHHMTIGFKQPVPEHLRHDIGKPVQLIASHLGFSKDAIAVKVSGYHSNNDTPHITVAIPKDGKPFNSNLITSWIPMDNVPLTGTVTEVYAQ